MAAYVSAPAAQETSPSPVNVNLTDTVPWGWYLAAVLLPIVGFIAGIVFMAKSKIGPAIALWMTCFLAIFVWSALLVAAGTGYTVSQFDNTAAMEAVATSTPDSGLSAYGECIAQAVTPEMMSACSDK